MESSGCQATCHHLDDRLQQGLAQLNASGVFQASHPFLYLEVISIVLFIGGSTVPAEGQLVPMLGPLNTILCLVHLTGVKVFVCHQAQNL